MTIGITDHALLRFLERAGGLDVEELRASLAASLQRAHSAARSVSSSDYLIRADGLLYVVRESRVTTILDDKGDHHAARALDGRHG